MTNRIGQNLLGQRVISFVDRLDRSAALYLVRFLMSDEENTTATAVKRYGWFDAFALKESYR